MFDPGQPLSHYRALRADVMLYCSGRDCAETIVVPLETAIGVMGESRGVREVYRFARTSCSCGMPWGESRPRFPKPKPWAAD